MILNIVQNRTIKNDLIPPPQGRIHSNLLKLIQKVRMSEYLIHLFQRTVIVDESKMRGMEHPCAMLEIDFAFFLLLGESFGLKQS